MYHGGLVWLDSFHIFLNTLYCIALGGKFVTFQKVGERQRAYSCIPITSSERTCILDFFSFLSFLLFILGTLWVYYAGKPFR